MNRGAMSDEENYAFEVTGFLHVPGVRGKAEVAALNPVFVVWRISQPPHTLRGQRRPPRDADRPARAAAAGALGRERRRQVLPKMDRPRNTVA